MLLALLLGGCAGGLGGGRWDAARTRDVNPINSMLHRHLPRDVAAGDLDGVLANYEATHGEGLLWEGATPLPEEGAERRQRWQGPEGVESLRERWRQILALFTTIERAEVRIHLVHWRERDARGIPATVRLLVRGIGPEGDRRMLDQRARLWLDRRGEFWMITGEQVTSRELVSADHPSFVVATESAGLRDVHDTDGSPTFRLVGEMSAASGAAAADVDCDGLEDLALLTTSRLTVYRNQADGSFAPANEELGFSGEVDFAGTGLVFFDAENDGDPDLWVSGILGERFYRNEGCARLVDDTTRAGLRPSRWSSMPIVADYDRDGFLDVYVVRMGDHEKSAPTPNWDAKNGTGDSLYRNRGDGTFVDATSAAGIDESGWGLAGAWADYDGDGDQDIYVGNEFGTNSLWRNQGDGTFIEVAAEARVLDRGAAMGVAWGDVDGDADLDLYVSNMYANSRWALFHPDFPSPAPWYFFWVPRERIDAITDELTRGSTLLRNDGDGTFTDVSEEAGIRDGQWGWGAEFLDYDADGHLDLFATNGFVTGELEDDV